MNPKEHWRQIAIRWAQVGSPLRPILQDQSNFSALLNLDNGIPRNALIMGVTPELWALPWPTDSTIRAIDRSLPMIEAIWPGDRSAAVHGNWLDLPFDRDSFDCVLCDGGLHLLGFPEGHDAWVQSAASVLRPSANFLIRLFALAPQKETLNDVWSLFDQGELKNFHEFKLRTLMALQSNPSTGVAVRDAYSAIHERIKGDYQELQDASGWSLDEIQTLDSYKDSIDVYHFTTEQESIEILTAQGAFKLLDRAVGDYPLAQRCPILLFEKS